MKTTTVKIEMCVPLDDGERDEKYRPFKAHKGDAAFDLMSAESGILNPGERKLFSDSSPFRKCPEKRIDGIKYAWNNRQPVSWYRRCYSL